MRQMRDLAELTAHEYLRVSLDRSGRQRSNTQQQDDNRRSWPFKFDRTYRDTGSASRYATKARDDYEVLLADIKAGRFGADVLVLWESSRGSRRVGEWSTLVELCLEHEILIAITTHHRVYDPANPRDRRSLIDDANDSEFESAKISERVLRSVKAAAENGRPHGRCNYGWQPVYDESNGRLVGRRVDEYAPMIVELYERLHAGHSLRLIATDFDQRGFRQRNGESFSPQALRSLALTEAYRGKRLHVPGRKSRRRSFDEPVLLYDAEWDGLVPEDLWIRVTRRLTDPARKTARPGRAKHLMSFLSSCDVCCAPISARIRAGRREYRCHRSQCVRLRADPLDALVRTVVVSYLSRKENAERLTANPQDEEALAAVRVEVAGIRAELDDLADTLGRNEITAGLAARAELGIQARLKAAEEREQRLATPPALAGFMSPGDDVAARWDAAPISARRDVVRLLFVPDLVGEMRICRSPTPGREIDPAERVMWMTA